MFRVAYGSATWLIAPLFVGLLMVGIGPWLGAPWLVNLASIPMFAFMFLWFFFRDPERRTADGIACPADGKVVRMDEVDDPDVGPANRLSIFMSPLDVHVNRFPVAGNVRSVVHRPGKHVPAFNKDSDRNERVETFLATDLGPVKVIQIAGAVARRIVPYSEKGDSVKAGERLGLIRLGSRCDLIVPRDSVEWTVQMGQKVFAGSTTVGKVR